MITLAEFDELAETAPDAKYPNGAVLPGKESSDVIVLRHLLKIKELTMFADKARIFRIARHFLVSNAQKHTPDDTSRIENEQWWAAWYDELLDRAGIDPQLQPIKKG